MIVVAMASQKGGSGKTTLSGHLAVEAERAGAGPVTLIDTDPQGSLSHWWNARAAQAPQFAKIGALELQSALAHLARSGTRLAIIDTPPAISESISHVIAHADLVIVPTRPSPHDLRAVGATVDMAERFGKPLIFVVNGATQRARITGEAAVALSQHGMVAPVTIHHRVDFAASMVDGRTVGEAVPNSASSKEIAELWVYIQDRLARLTKDATFTPEILPEHFSLAPLSALDAGEMREPGEPLETRGAAKGGQSPQVVETAQFLEKPQLAKPQIVERLAKPQIVEPAEIVERAQLAKTAQIAETTPETAQIVETHQTDAMTYGGGVGRRAEMERRDAPRGSALFTSPERRAGVFGRRHVDNYEAGRGK